MLEWLLASTAVKFLGRFVRPVGKGLSVLCLIRFFRRHFLKLPKPAQWIVCCLYTILIATLIDMVIFAWFLKKDPLVIFMPNIHDPNFTFFLYLLLFTILPVAPVMYALWFRGVGGTLKDTAGDLLLQPPKRFIERRGRGMKKQLDRGWQYIMARKPARYLRWREKKDKSDRGSRFRFLKPRRKV